MSLDNVYSNKNPQNARYNVDAYPVIVNPAWNISTQLLHNIAYSQLMWWLLHSDVLQNKWQSS